jgi:outer membrane protein
VEYALANNISVKQADLQTRFSRVQLQQDRMSQLPFSNFQTSSGFRFGLSENPSTGILESNNLFNSQFGVSANVTLFNWFSRRYQIQASDLTVQADEAQEKKVQDDIALNVAVGYLQALLAKQQVNIAVIQMQQTFLQLDITRKKVNKGALPEINALQLEAQLAADSSNLVSTTGNAQQLLLQLKAVLNLDAAIPFDIESPPVERIPVESLAELQPDVVYNLAVINLPQQRVNDLRIQAAQKLVSAAKGDKYPTISAFGGLNTSYVDLQRFQPLPFGKQVRNNFGQNIGLGLTVPISSGGSLHANLQRSRLRVQQLILEKENANQTLKQDIYSAYTDAVTSLQKFNASKRAVEAAEKAYSFAQKRYDVNLLPTYELINTQNNLQRARQDMLIAQFDYVFRMKLLEFYKGQGLKL